MNEVFTARRSSETSVYAETKTVKTTSSINLNVPLSQISAKLGYTVETSVSSTIRGTTSAPLKANESTAFYFREHWKEYSVKIKETSTTYVKGKLTQQISYQTKTIRVPQKLVSKDYGWFYSMDAKALPKTLDEKYCSNDYSCKVK